MIISTEVILQAKGLLNVYKCTISKYKCNYIYILAYRNNTLKRIDLGRMIANLQESISFNYSGINMENNYIYSAAAPHMFFLANSKFSKWRKVLINSPEFKKIKTQLNFENQIFATNIEYYFATINQNLLVPLPKLILPHNFETEMNYLFLKYTLFDTEKLIHKLGIQKNIIWATDNQEYLLWVYIILYIYIYIAGEN